MDKIKLKTDFLDYYDHHFDRTGQTFERLSTNSLDRTGILKTLRSYGFLVPTFGMPNDTSHLFYPECPVVVYTDEFAHCGQGKILSTYKEAVEKYNNCLISEFIDCEVPCLSLRYLCIGDRAWILSYKSDDEWRSNCGDVAVVVEKEIDASYFRDKCPYPMFAIDFVKDKSNEFYAVDFNTSPGLKYTGMEEILKPKEVVDLIRNFYKKKATGGLLEA